MDEDEIKNTLQKTYFVSQSTLLMKQLREFLSQNQSIALVVDEYGEIEGLISVEDIFKEITGKFGGNNIKTNFAVDWNNDLIYSYNI